MEMMFVPKAVLIDLSGTLHVGSHPTANAVSALVKLRSKGIPVRFCSNTSKESTASLLKRLRSIGFQVSDDELFTSLKACRILIEERKLNPLKLLSDSALEEFQSYNPEATEYDSVLVGLAPEQLNYDQLNKAFRILSNEPINGMSSSDHLKPVRLSSPPSLIATHRATVLGADDGSLSMGPGPFIVALENASNVTAEVVGKPSRSFFEQTLRSLKEEGVGKDGWKECVIVGDDWKNDLGEGAVEVGLKRFLVRTGKYRKGDENKSDIDGCFDSFSDLVDNWV